MIKKFFKGYYMSHTKDLMDEAMLKINEYLQVEHDKELGGVHGLKTNINHLTEKFGVHIMRLNDWTDLVSKKFNVSDKFSCIQFYTISSLNPQPFDEFYEMLENDVSKKEFDWYVKYRTAYAFLGEGVYALFTPSITKEIYKKYEMQITISKNGYFDVDGFSINVKNERTLPAHTFLIEQYRLPNLVEPTEGDIVLDVGACFGDTAIWFKRYIKDSGKVFAFEPVGYSFAILKENIERNKITNIIPEKLALSDHEGTLSILGKGGAAKLSANGSEEVKVTTIDRFVEEQKLDRIDFIEMDIEGAELRALMGAENSLKKFRPKLAICVYHKGDDLITIPKYIKSINGNYKFFLRQNSIGLSETVLYAISSV